MADVVMVPIAEYNSLIEDRNWLQALENAGVDNWPGIDFARELLNEQD